MRNKGKYIINALIFCLFFANVLDGKASGEVHFIENRGQWPEDVLYRVGAGGLSVYIEKHALKYVFIRHGHNHEGSSGAVETLVDGVEDKPEIQVIEVRFVDAHEYVLSHAEDEVETVYNYFLGNDRSRWASGVRAYKRVRLDDLYENIDLQLYMEQGRLKYDLVVQPGAQLRDIRMKYAGHNGLELQDGKLVVSTSTDVYSEHIPMSYQSDDQGRRAPISCSFALDEDEVYFEVDESYDPGLSLTIDPELIFSTYSGSTADNWGFTATYDDQGNLYSGGIVQGAGFPTSRDALQPGFAFGEVGSWDVGILKYDSTGTNLLYGTYLGGTSSEVPASLIVNNRGELLIYGTTSSTDFPVSSDAYQSSYAGGLPLNPVPGVVYHNGSDLYVSKVSQNGDSLLSSTYLGGLNNDGLIQTFQLLTKNYGDQYRGEVFIDEDDNVYVASTTSSDNFPVFNGFQSVYGGGANDGVVFKLNSTLSELVWSTFIGGAAMDAVYSIRVDRDQNVFVGGGTHSTDYPTTSGALKTSKPDLADIDGVISLISSTGDSLISSSYIGTTAYDQVYMIDLDSSQNVYLLGQTQGAYPVTAGVYSNPNSGQFLHKLGHDLDTTYYSTVIGSRTQSPDFRPTAFLVNECENVFISGWGGRLNRPDRGYIGGSTFNLPITENAFQKETDGSDFYLMVLLKDASKLLYGTYFGESTAVNGDHVDGGTSRFDKRGIVYQSVCGSCGATQGFPTTPGAWSNTNNSSNCNNAAFKFDLASLLARFTTDSPEFDDPGVTSGCDPFTVVFLNRSIGGEDYFWDFGEGTTTEQPDSITITYPGPGVYPVSLTATDINTCVRESVARGTISVFDFNFSIMESDSICYGDKIELYAEGGISYSWMPAETLSNPNTSNPIASPDTTTQYKVFVVDENNCDFEDSVVISVIPEVIPSFEYLPVYDCFDAPEINFVNTSENSNTYYWDFGDGNISEEFEPTYRYIEEDTFTVTLRAEIATCTAIQQKEIVSIKPFIPNFFSPNGDQVNDYFEVISDRPIRLKIFNRWGKLVYGSDQYDNSWAAEGLASGVYFYEITFSDNITNCNGWVHVMR